MDGKNRKRKCSLGYVHTEFFKLFTNQAQNNHTYTRTRITAVNNKKKTEPNDRTTSNSDTKKTHTQKVWRKKPSVTQNQINTMNRRRRAFQWSACVILNNIIIIFMKPAPQLTLPFASAICVLLRKCLVFQCILMSGHVRNKIFTLANLTKRTILLKWEKLLFERNI